MCIKVLGSKHHYVRMSVVACACACCACARLMVMVMVLPPPVAVAVAVAGRGHQLCAWCVACLVVAGGRWGLWAVGLLNFCSVLSLSAWRDD